MLVQAIVDELGDAATVALYRDYVTKRFIKTPLIRRFVEAWLRLSGTSPASLLRFSVKGWATTYRNVGTLALEGSDDHTATLVLRDVPLALFEMPVFMVVFQGVFEGLVAVSGTRGTATLHRPPAASTFACLVGASSRRRATRRPGFADGVAHRALSNLRQLVAGRG
jgi:hypothetical protein